MIQLFISEFKLLIQKCWRKKHTERPTVMLFLVVMYYNDIARSDRSKCDKAMLRSTFFETRAPKPSHCPNCGPRSSGDYLQEHGASCGSAAFVKYLLFENLHTWSRLAWCCTSQSRSKCKRIFLPQDTLASLCRIGDAGHRNWFHTGHLEELSISPIEEAWLTAHDAPETVYDHQYVRNNRHRGLEALSAVMKGKRSHKYSVLLPTYNERENIGIIVALLVRTFESRWAMHSFLLMLQHFRSVIMCQV